MTATSTGATQLTLAESLRFDLDAGTVVVVDPQNDFCHAEGLQARLGKDVRHAQAALRRLAAFLGHARALDVPVVFVCTEHTATTDSLAWNHRHPDPDRPRACEAGTWGAQFCGVAPAPADLVLVKHRYSAFAGTRLRSLLEELGRTSLLFTGFATGTCVECSLREAVCQDLLTTLVEDCCADYTTKAHTRAVDAVAAGFGMVSTSGRVIHGWTISSRRGGRERRGPEGAGS